MSSQFSGDGFSDMGFTVHALSKDDFATWVEKAKAGQGPVLDRASYDVLNRPSKRNPPVTYRSMDPNLFHAIATREIPPGAGVSEANAGPAVRPRQEH
jgi:cytochrome o ubiquinol oxidase subunit 2